MHLIESQADRQRQPQHDNHHHHNERMTSINEFSWAYHFSTWLVSMQKKERHQRKTQLHMQNMSGHMQNWTTNKQKKKTTIQKARLDPWSDALNCVLMNPKWPLLRRHRPFQAYASGKCIIRPSDASLRGSVSEISTSIRRAAFAMIHCQR